MDDRLTTDEYEALNQIGKASRGERPSACIARNSKKLNGLKFISHAKDGHLMLTEKGQQTLFLRQCIEGLRAVSTDPLTALAADVSLFLGKKGHITRNDDGSFEITQRGRESLADIDASAK
ncbi:putative transcriptional regulator [Actimicrobium sp. GrIS 1.19]|uniref:hypothetical protein n=1 Tax=Actimicrobium sp. GrIS 1.19 TaxID=3071708 RepID=UPI002E01C0E9|nr:putative transcriptional regulator [Actimicrobium sp. GrIS 1.19]